MPIAPKDIPAAVEALVDFVGPHLADLARIRHDRGIEPLNGFVAVPRADGWTFRFDAADVIGARPPTGHETMRRSAIERTLLAAAVPRLDAILAAQGAALLRVAVIIRSNRSPYSHWLALTPLDETGALSPRTGGSSLRAVGREIQRLAKLARTIPTTLRAPVAATERWSVTLECSDRRGGAYRTTAVLDAESPEAAVALAALRHRTAFVCRCLAADTPTPASAVTLVDIHRHWDIDDGARLRLQSHVDCIVGVRSLAA